MKPGGGQSTDGRDGEFRHTIEWREQAIEHQHVQMHVEIGGTSVTLNEVDDARTGAALATQPDTDRRDRRT